MATPGRAGLVGARSPLVAAGLVTSGASMLAVQPTGAAQVRMAGWATWAGSAFSGGVKSPRVTQKSEELRENLPDIFETPVEVEDYIKPEKTYFERLEDLWDWVLSFASPVDKQMGWMRGAHESLDVSWGIVFLMWGIFNRLVSLGPMLYAHRNTLRMGRCANQTNEVVNNIKRIKNDKNLTTPEQRVMTDGYKRMEKALYKKNRCSKYGSFVAGAASPLLVTSFMAIRQLAAYEDDLESEKFLWVTDLTMPDPTLVLPGICTLLFLSNFEMNQRLNRGGRSSMGLYMRWGIRVGAIGFAYSFSSQPACLFAYWIGMSTAGMIQPLLLRNQKFRDYWEFPDPPKVAAAHEDHGPWQWIKTRMSSKEVREAAEKAQAEKRAAAAAPKFESINDHDIIFDEVDDKAAVKKPAAK